jgi:DNA-binding GntR family transcriptional regulator
MTGLGPLPRMIESTWNDESHMPIGPKVYNVIKTAIINGTFEPGTSMTEVELARQLNVSRTPIRDALRALHQERLLIRERGRGYVICIPTEKDIREVFEIRRLIEIGGLAKAAKSGKELYKKLAALVDRARAALHHGNMIELRDINDAFHSTLAEQVNNKRLFSYYVSVQAEISRLRLYAIERNDWARRSVIDHECMVNFIRAGEIKRAINQLERHIADAERTLLDRFAESKLKIDSTTKQSHPQKVHVRKRKPNDRRGGVWT